MYLIEYIKESQVEFPSISKSPYAVMAHLLFTNGNGCEIEDGNFIIEFKYGRKVPYLLYYKDVVQKQDMIDEYDRMNRDIDIERGYDIRKDHNDRLKEICTENEKIAQSLSYKIKDNDTLWKQVCDEYNNRYNKHNWIDQYTIKDLKTKTFWKRCINSYEFNPYLQLHDKYYKAYYFNENTDNNLLKVTIALSFALIDTMTDLLESGNFKNKNPLFGFDMNSEEIDTYSTVYPEDIKKLKKLIEKCQSYIKD